MRAITVLPGVANSARLDDIPPPPRSDGAILVRSLALGTVFGTVKANRSHYEMAALALGRADQAWLDRLITRRMPVGQWSQAPENRADDIKVIVDFTG